ncbi:hypothetical protein SynPROS71_00940 [Synechococcus sp. PROS-7-1]|nr:hypothetical protein SynPROS71_00940 [Synechococcus sp. PROS-7-1]
MTRRLASRAANPLDFEQKYSGLAHLGPRSPFKPATIFRKIKRT